MQFFKENEFKYIWDKDEDNPRINLLMRFIMLPLAILWWGLQLFGMTMLGCAGSVVFLIIALGSVFQKPYDRDFTLIQWLQFPALIITAPFIWWYKYWKFGEYNMLIKDNNF